MTTIDPYYLSLPTGTLSLARTTDAPSARESSRMAVAALALGNVSIAGSWLPTYGHVFFLTAIVALAMGVLGANDAARGRSRGLLVSVVAVLVSMVALAVVVSVQSVFSGPLSFLG